jgi:hypothetical protein
MMIHLNYIEAIDLQPEKITRFNYLLIICKADTSRALIIKKIEELGITDFEMYYGSNYETLLFKTEEDANLYRLTDNTNVIFASSTKDIKPTCLSYLA